MSDEIVKGPKKQHWLPCAYLQFFSISGKRIGRKTRIYFTDGKISKEAPVKDLAVEKFTYSKKDPLADFKFHDYEQEYPTLIEKIINGDIPDRKNSHKLMLIIWDLHLRNISYQNRTDSDRAEIHDQISRDFMALIFEETKSKGNDFKEANKHLTENWRLLTIQPITQEKFITSDNPSIIFSEPVKNKPVLTYIPIHPHVGIIIYDQRSIAINCKNISDDEIAVLNGLQANCSINHVFSDYNIENEKNDWKCLVNQMQKSKPQRWIDTSENKAGLEWQPGFVSIFEPWFSRLKFLKLKKQKTKE